MGCSSCAQRARLRGMSAAAPHVIGNQNDGPATAVVVNVDGLIAGVRAGRVAWVTGDGVQDAIDRGDITIRPERVQAPPSRQPNTVYWVGSRGFTNYERAVAVSNSTGIPISDKSPGGN